MLLIELMNYFEKGTPIRITDKNNSFNIDCYSEHIEEVLKKMENLLKIENFYIIMTDANIKNIYYDDTNAEAIGIILKEENIFSIIKSINVWYDYSEKIYKLRRYSDKFNHLLYYKI